MSIFIWVVGEVYGRYFVFFSFNFKGFLRFRCFIFIFCVDVILGEVRLVCVSIRVIYGYE